MGTFKESRTAKNLLTSFAFESQASARYHFFANKAQKETLIQISAVFEETALQEREHALRFFKFFNGGELEITASFKTGVIQTTYDNLISSADLENNVHSVLYPGFAAIAREEGFQRAADTWDAISVAEVQHEKTFLALAQNVRSGNVLSRERKMRWRCRNCGYIHEGTEAPAKCPACVRPAGHFELFCEPW